MDQGHAFIDVSFEWVDVQSSAESRAGFIVPVVLMSPDEQLPEFEFC